MATAAGPMSSSAPTSSASASTAKAQEILSLPVDERGFVSEEIRDRHFRRLRQRLENRTCFDCAARNPTWLSTSHGIFLCLNCSGTHRRMGTHISFVRSSELDLFTPEQLLRMELGGNAKARAFFKLHGLMDSKTVDYHSRTALKHRQQVEREAQAAMGANPSSPTATAAASPKLTTASGEPPVPPAAGRGRSFSSDWGEIDGTPAGQKPNPKIAAPVLPKAVELPKAPVLSSGVKTKTTVTTLSSGGAGASGHFASGVGQQNVKAKKLDFDFDFDSIEEVPMPVASAPPSLATVPEMKPVVNSTLTSKSQVNNGRTPATNSTGANRFSGMKAISSADYFADETSASSSNFGGSRLPAHVDPSSRAISSDMYFGTANNKPVATYEDETAAQIAQLTEQAKVGISTLVVGAQETVGKAKDWLNQQMQRAQFY